MKQYLIIALLLILPFTAVAGEVLQTKHDEAHRLADEFTVKLKQELVNAMKEGGPVHAIEVCRIKAPEIAKNLSAESGWHVKRVSLKPRGKTAYADNWERTTLYRFEEQASSGRDIKTLEKIEIVKTEGRDTIRYMKAIPTGGICLTCHGDSINESIKLKLSEYYPRDKATGYKAGDIRGAFSFRQTVK